MEEHHHAKIGFTLAVTAAFGVMFYGVVTMVQNTQRPSTTNNAFAGSPYLPELPDNALLPTDVPQVLESDLTIGPAAAPVTIVEFGDYSCLGCGEAMQPLIEIFAAYPDQLRLVWKDNVLEGSDSRAQSHAEAARCAGEQGKFWEMHDRLLLNQPVIQEIEVTKFADQLSLDRTQFQACRVSRRQAANVEIGKIEGQALGVEELPFFFINRQRLSGVPTAPQLQSLIEEELARSPAAE